MSTQAEYFASKTRCLEDYASRLFWNSRNVPPTSILKTLTYFETTLLSILKDLTVKKQFRTKVDNFNKLRENFIWRGKCTFPDLDYFILFDGLVALIPGLQDVTSDKRELINLLLSCLSLLMIFVDESTQVELPVIVASSLNTFSKTNGALQTFMMETLCNKIVPLCLGSIPQNEEFDLNMNGVPRIITFVLEEISDIRQHYKLIETLMFIKTDLWKDLMAVISYNDGRTIRLAVQLLFHYFPDLNASKLNEHEVRPESLYKRLKCGNQKCTSEIAEISSLASFIVFDPFLAAKHGSTSPPLYLCSNCCKTLLGNDEDVTKVLLMMPVSKISSRCFNSFRQRCDETSTATMTSSSSSTSSSSTSSRSKLTSVCSQMFAKGISSYMDRPLDGGLAQRLVYDEESYEVEGQELIRYCESCLQKVESSIDPWTGLILQTSPRCAWDYPDNDTRQLIVDCILGLLTSDTNIHQSSSKQSQPSSNVGGTNANMLANNPTGAISTDTSEDFGDFETYSCGACLDNIWYQKDLCVVGHFGVWMLVSLCPAQQNIPKEQASQLITAVIVWFGRNSRLSNDEFGNELERLKSDYLVDWLREMYRIHPKIFISTLVPNPPPENRIQGHWDRILPAWKQYKEVLELVTCLAAYSVVKLDIWEVIVPAWMTAIARNLDSSDVLKLKSVLNGLFDKDMSPFGVSQEKLFGFASKLFNQSPRSDQERVLEWLQVLCEIEVYIPLDILTKMFLQAENYLRFSTDPQAVTVTKKCPCPESHLIYEMKRTIEEVEADSYGICSFERAFSKTNSDPNATSSRDPDWLKPRADSKDEETSSLSKKNSVIRRSSSQTRRFPAVKEAISKFSPAYMHRTRSQRSGKGKQSFSSKQLRNSFIGTPQLARQHSLNGEDLMSNCDNSKINFRQCSDLDDTLLVSCFVEMVDIILQQIHLQAFPRHEALRNDQKYGNLFLLLNGFVARLVKRSINRAQFSLPSDELKTKLIDTEGWLLEMFYDLLSKLLKYILPKMEIVRGKFSAAPCHDTKREDEPSSSNTQTKWVDDDYSYPVQLLRNLLLVLKSDPTTEIRTSIVTSVSLLCLHCYVKDPTMLLRSSHDQALWSFERDILFDGLWKQLRLRYSNLVQETVPIVFACMTSLRSFFEATIHFFETSFSDDGGDLSVENWSSTLTSIDQIHSLLVFIDGTIFSSQSPVTHIISRSMYTILDCLRHLNTVTVTKATFILNSLSIRSIKDACKCMESEFDAATTDRCVLLTALGKLHKLRPDARIFSFSFFTKRIDALVNEALFYQKYGKRHPFPTTVGSQTLDEDQPPTSKKEMEDKESTKRDPNRKFVEYSELEQVHQQFVSVMCEFLIDCESEAAATCNYQALGVFIRQFYGMFGYSDEVALFSFTTLELCQLTGFHSFLSAAPKILDRSTTLGNMLLPMIFLLLEVSVLPCRQTYNIQPFDTSGNQCQHYSLEQLPENLRMSWLTALQVIMYKYELLDADHEKQLYLLIIICLNTVEGAYHKCARGMLVVDTFETALDGGRKEVDNSPKFEQTKRTPSTNNKSTEEAPSYSECYPQQQQQEQHHQSEADEKKNTNPPKYVDAVKLSTPPCEASCSYETPKTEINSCSDSDLKQQRQQGASDKFENIAYDASTDPLNEAERRTLDLKCGRCHHPIKELSSNVLSLCMINLGHYVRYDPCSAVPLLPRILEQLAAVYQPVHHHGSLNLAASATHKFGMNATNLVAKQEIRCILRQLADLQILTRIFFKNTQFGNCFIPVLVSCLRNYPELPLCDVISHVLKGMGDDMSGLKPSSINKLLSNMAVFISSLIDLTSGGGNWQQLVTQMLHFFNKIQSYISSTNASLSFDRLLRLMSSTLKVAASSSVKQTLLEPYSKILSNLLTSRRFALQNLHELCSTAYQVFTKERDMLTLMRVVSGKLVTALKNNASCMIEQNILSIMQLILHDIGSTLGPDLTPYLYTPTISSLTTCHAAEIIRIHLSDLLEILGNENSFRNKKLFDYIQGDQPGRNLSIPLNSRYSFIRPVEASDLKLSIGQMLAYELSEEKRHLNTYFPLLTSRPSNLQRGPKEFQESLQFVKKFNWILLASLERLLLDTEVWKPLPIDLASSVANVIQVVLTGCLETNKQEESAMTSLLHACIFCQLWTIYCEQITHSTKPSLSLQSDTSAMKSRNHDQDSTMFLLEFWSRITPSLLVLLGKDEPISGIVRKNLVSMIKTLQRCDSAILLLLYKMWKPMLNLKDPSPKMEVHRETDHLLETNMIDTKQETECTFAQNIRKIISEMKKKLALIDQGEDFMNLV